MDSVKLHFTQKTRVTDVNGLDDYEFNWFAIPDAWCRQYAAKHLNIKFYVSA